MVQKEPSTSELRHDWLSDRWVIIAPQRNDRPDDFTHPQDASLASTGNDRCPFCRGHENETPNPVAVYPASTLPGHQPPWLVRVVPNKFPAVNGVQSLRFPGMPVAGIPVAGMPMPGSPAAGASMPASYVAEARTYLLDESTAEAYGNCGAPSTHSVDARAIDLYRSRSVAGAHEVIIESPLHLRSLTQLDRQTVSLIFRAYRDRLQHWRRCEDIAYAVVFKNVGFDAGASLVHTHSQLIATNILPTDIKRTVERMELFVREEGCCLFCRMLNDELEENVRVKAQTSDFVAFCPFASRLPSLVMILPRDHARHSKKQTTIVSSAVVLADAPRLAIDRTVLSASGLQLRPPHFSARGVDCNAAFHLAPGNIPSLNSRRRFRMGLGLLYQSASAGTGGSAFASMRALAHRRGKPAACRFANRSDTIRLFSWRAPGPFGLHKTGA
ncbi:MAG: hypothetical protein U0892_06340 [Pirellulales bacterium]